MWITGQAQTVERRDMYETGWEESLMTLVIADEVWDMGMGQSREKKQAIFVEQNMYFSFCFIFYFY